MIVSQKNSSPRLHDGALLATVLAGTWREEPPLPAITAEQLSRLVPLLIGSGTAGFVWRSMSRDAALKAAEGASELRNAHHHFAIQASVKGESLDALATEFSAAGLEPLVFKGWAIARYYAAPHLRPFGDLDLCAPPGRHAEAAALLGKHISGTLRHDNQGLVHLPNNFQVEMSSGLAATVDLHADLKKYRCPSLAAVYGRSIPVRLSGGTVRVPALEDHLRLAILHFLRHGGWRPLWLTDIAAMLESANGDFNWDLCLGEEPHVRRWIACILQLAGDLLGARIEHVPTSSRIADMPRWIAKTVLNEWRAPFAARQAVRPLGDAIADPRLFPGELVQRWPNAIRATADRDGPFDASTRLPYQLASFTASAWGRVARTFAGPAATLVEDDKV